MMSEHRVVELELDTPRLLFALIGLVVLVSLAFFVGRWTADSAVANGAANGPSSSAVVDAAPAEDLGEAGLFDAADEQGVRRDTSRQVTAEQLAAGRYEIVVGTTDSRQTAERWREASDAVGVPAVVIGESGGRYRVAAGPFDNDSAAKRAAQLLERAVGRRVEIRDGSR